MKFLKRFNEALKPSQFRKYVDIFDKERYKDIFKEIGDKYEHDKNYYRVYIPFVKDEIKGYISKTHEDVEKFLNDNSCTLIDYIKGKAKFNDSKNETTIGKILTRLKNDKLNIEFQSDEKRKALANEDDLLIVISRHPYDIAGSDTDRNWTNCMTIGTDNSNRLTKLMDEYENTKSEDTLSKIKNYKQNGINVKYLIHEVKEGSLISYLIKSKDKNINNPLAVLNIKPFSNEKQNILVTSKNMYGTKRPEFKNIVDNILDEYFNKNLVGKFYINKKVYNDDKDIRFRFDGSIDEICKLLDIYSYKINNGLIDVNGNVDLSDKNLQKLPLKFGIVSGDFSCRHNQLTSLDGAPKKVGGDFSCSHNQLKSLDGAPKKVGGSFFCSHNQLTSLEGAPEEVGDSFACTHNQLKSLNYAPKEVGGTFYCDNNQLTSLEGAPEKVVGNFICNNNQIKSLEGSLKSVGANFECDEIDIESILSSDIKISGCILANGKYLKWYNGYTNK